jgi:N-methylhydantoinase A
MNAPFSAPPTRSLRLAVDIGGTFTDLVLRDENGRERTYKTSSTPKDPSDGFFAGIDLIAADFGLDRRGLLSRIDAILHGTTITTNALLTGATARTGLLTTEGFRDVLLARQGHRENQFNSKASPPPSLVPRELIVPVRERVDRSGRITLPLDEEAVRAAAALFREKNVAAVAVSFLFSFFHDAHERRAGEILAEELPGVFISLSSRVAPEVRFYERTSTTVLNAAVGPVLDRYLSRLAARLAGEAFDRPLYVMQSNGGVVRLANAAARAVNTLLSGPAGAPPAAADRAAALGIDNVMAIDMGGTSFEVSLSRKGRTEVSSSGEIGGHPISTPLLDISTIGAGGGSIAWVTPGGLMRVGPQSAGAHPGPAAYGRGGVEATVTDANLVLGYLNPAKFNASVALDSDRAHRAVAAIGERLGLSTEHTAAGVYRTINAAMTDSLRLATIRKGLDPRDFAIVAAGGAGPLHAAALARDLDIPLVVVPRNASVLCAGGMLLTDYTRFYVRTLPVTDPADPQLDLDQEFSELEKRAIQEFTEEGIHASRLAFERSADLRYVNQVHEISAPFTADAASLVALFHQQHRERFGHAQPNDPVEIINVRLLARGAVSDAKETRSQAEFARERPPERRKAWFAGGFRNVPVYDGEALGAQREIDGPALVELPTSTIVVPEGFRLVASPTGDYLLHEARRSLAEVLSRLQASIPSKKAVFA